MTAEILEVEFFYAYGYQGRDMYAIRAPFATTADAPDLIGRRVRLNGTVMRITAISRQISGPIARGEPIGIEIAPVEPELRA